MKEIKDIFPDYHDGEFLAPKSGAKLASLFGLCQAEPEGNESFKFTAPKQPKKVPPTLGPSPQKQAPPPTVPTVLLAAAVYAFRFVNGQYVKHGKLGAAILGNHVNKEYKVLLYGSQQKQITTARIHHGFVLTVQPGNYTAFYDDQQQSWSLKFDSEEARMDFCKEVCVARWNSQTCGDTLLTQDLVHGEGQTISIGETVEVTLSSWLLQNHAMRKLSDSNLCKGELQRVSLCSDPARMGWEKGMLGMQKGGRRLIIVPPGMGCGSKGVPKGVPPSSALVFAVEVHQVNFSKDPGCVAAGSTENKCLVPGLDRVNVESSVQSALGCSDQGDQALWVKCRTLNELPKPYIASQLQPFTPTFPPQHTPCLTDIGAFMMTEARQHNTEIRLAVARVTDKVDYLASKVDELHKQSNCSFALPSGSLETAMILHNIQRIIQENTSLKMEVLEKGSRVEDQESKTGELTEQRCMEKRSSLLDQTNDLLQSSSHHARLLQAEQEKVRLAEELDMSSSRVCKLQQEADGLQQRVTELQAELQESRSHSALISCLESKMEELKKEVVQSQQQWREEKQKGRKMTWTITTMEEEIQDLRAENKRLNQLLSDRKRKWQQERERFLLEQEEQRSSSEQERQHLLAQLRKVRVSTGTHSRPQLELEWQQKCDAELKEQKLKLEEVITQLQKQNAKFLKELEREREQLDAQLAVQVKCVMNSLFHSLREEFDLQESYSGESVLKIVLSTIKCVTMLFLNELKSEEEEEEEYISAEERLSERMDEHRIKSEETESPQSLDHTYITAYETNSLEASEVGNDSSLASDIEKQSLNSE